MHNIGMFVEYPSCTIYNFVTQQKSLKGRSGYRLNLQERKHGVTTKTQYNKKAIQGMNLQTRLYP